MKKDGRMEEAGAREVALTFIINENPCIFLWHQALHGICVIWRGRALGRQSWKNGLCSIKRRVAISGGVVHLRLCLKELIRGWGIVFGMVLRRGR